MPGSPITVALDVTSLIGPRTGVGALTAHLVGGLARRDDVETRAFAVTWRGRGALDDAVPDVTLSSRPMAARPLRAAWRRMDWPPIQWWTGTVDVVHGPNFVVPPARGAAGIVTVHDMTAWRFPQLVDRATATYPALVARAIDRGAWIHTPSRFVADEVTDRLEVDADRVVTVPNGAIDLPTVAPGSDAATGRQLSGGDRYILAVGTVEPRKDLPGLVRAFDAVAGADPDVRLVLVGPDGWGADALTTAIQGARHRRRVVRLGWVDDRTRAALLRGSQVLAYPSIYEGFGLVPLEAMAAGVPVVATRTGAIPEVVGDAACLVPVGDVDALAGALSRVLADEALRAELVAAGHRCRARFDPTATIAGIVDLYRRAVDARSA